MYFNPMYFVFALPALILALIAQARVQSAVNKYSRVRTSRNATGAQVARAILDNAGLPTASSGRARRCRSAASRGSPWTSAICRCGTPTASRSSRAASRRSRPRGWEVRHNGDFNALAEHFPDALATSDGVCLCHVFSLSVHSSST